MIKGNDVILIDPFLNNNPDYDWRNVNVADIFVTHGHSDHLGSAIDISTHKRAQITAVFELANYCFSKGAKTRRVGLGSWLNYDWGRAIFLPAFHSSSNNEGQYTGCPASILFDIGGVRIFHAGDTCLSYEMKMIKEAYKPDVALLPIGGTFTMDIEAAVTAAKWLGANIVIPMHYNTFEQINADPIEFQILIEDNKQVCQVLGVNEALNF